MPAQIPRQQQRAVKLRRDHRKQQQLRTHLVELQHSKLDLLVLVLLLLGLSVGLLLTLLSSSQQAHDNVHGGLIRHTSRSKCDVIL